jgi:hypothetical protein
MPELPLNRTPQFRIGEQVVVISPTADQGKKGVVVQVIGHLGDFVYRYDVRLAHDGSLKRYFGFEIDSVMSRTA